MFHSQNNSDGFFYWISFDFVFFFFGFDLFPFFVIQVFPIVTFKSFKMVQR